MAYFLEVTDNYPHHDEKDFKCKLIEVFFLQQSSAFKSSKLLIKIGSALLCSKDTLQISEAEKRKDSVKEEKWDRKIKKGGGEEKRERKED